MKKLLLHTCCGPCFLGTWEQLKTSGLLVTNYYYNPNIYPKEEYEKRLENLLITAKNKSQEVITGEYQQDDYFRVVKGLEKEFPKRCLKCYGLRLLKTAQRAKKDNYEYFSTTLLVSPYQRHEELKEIGKKIAKEVGVEFYYKDWRPYYQEGQNIAKSAEIYRQKYCGCLFSKEYR